MLSGLVDLPVACSFIFIGILLYTFYQVHPTPGLPQEHREAFPFFILHEMPAGMRGLVTAGILSTAMGSLSTALNALGTSFARDFVLPRMRSDLSETKRVNVLRWSTVLFAFFIIIVGIFTAWYMAKHPDAAIIPLVLGILGFTFGSLLGVFLVAVLTKTRGNDFGNVLGMTCGFLAVLFLSNVLGVQQAVGFTSLDEHGKVVPMLVLSFPWRITLGTLVTIAIALCFKTPEERIQHAGATVPASPHESTQA